MELKPYKTATVFERYIKGILPIMVCLLLVYTSCRKDSSTAPSTSTQSTSNVALSKQIAMNLSKSLAGTFGGVNMKDGVNVSVEDHLGPHHACGCHSGNTLCGFFTDSLVNYNATSGDTTIHTGGFLKFFFNCIDGKLSGYTAYDSLNTTKTTTASVSQYKVQQYYTIVALDSAKNFIGVNGTNDLHTSITYTDNSTPQIGGAFYQLTNLKIDVINKDILSGTATFKAYGSNWNASGTIVFLGNHQADFTLNGTTTHITVTF
jgi:hypothetical protein